MRYIKFLTFLFILTACTQGQQETQSDLNSESNSALSSTEMESSNSLLVSENMVVFLLPGAKEIEEMQAKYSEDVYVEIIADMTWYPGLASEVLDSLKIKNVYFSKDSLVIRDKAKVETILIRKELEGDMVLINLNKEPIIKYSIDFDKKEVLQYFEPFK